MPNVPLIFRDCCLFLPLLSWILTKRTALFPSVVKTFIQTFLHLERTLRETPELLTVGEVKRTLMIVVSELKGLRDCTELVPSDEAKVECERIKTR